MNACVLTIGNELLQGFTLDTNSTWIGKKLKLNEALPQFIEDSSNVADVLKDIVNAQDEEGEKA